DAVPDRIGDAFAAASTFLAGSGQAISAPAVALFRTRDGGVDVRAGYPAPPALTGSGAVSVIELPCMEAARLEHVGPYETLPEAKGRIEDTRGERGRGVDPSVPGWEEYWSPPETPARSSRTVIYRPLLPA